MLHSLVLRYTYFVAYFVYILQCEDGSLYTGLTTDVKRRFAEHKAGTGGAYTRSHGAERLVYAEKKKDRSAASKREAEIKRLSRAEKMALIATQEASRTSPRRPRPSKGRSAK